MSPGLAARGLAVRRGRRLVLHDVDLAARFCDRLVALKGGRLIADGSPGDIMDSGTLESIYGVPMGVMERAPGQWVSYVH